ncbi:MAG: hypothetical protein ACI90U_002592 [Pseudomonadales bacterium]|jgi:uncharacterized protein YggT (Ycf19 family)
MAALLRAIITPIGIISFSAISPVVVLIAAIRGVTVNAPACGCSTISK